MLNKKGISPTILLFVILAFALIIDGSILTRYDPDPKVSIIAGILAGIGVGLLGLASLLKWYFQMFKLQFC